MESNNHTYKAVTIHQESKQRVHSYSNGNELSQTSYHNISHPNPAKTPEATLPVVATPSSPKRAISIDGTGEPDYTWTYNDKTYGRDDDGTFYVFYNGKWVTIPVNNPGDIGWQYSPVGAPWILFLFLTAYAMYVYVRRQKHHKIHEANISKHISFLLLFTSCTLTAQAWNQIYLLNSDFGWTKNDNSPKFTNIGNDSLCVYLANESSFAFYISGQQYGPASNGVGIGINNGTQNGDTHLGTSGHTAAKYTGPNGMVIIHSNQQDATNGDTNPWIWLTRPIVQFKYPWEGGSNWYFRPAIDHNDGTYSCIGTYQGVNGFNWTGVYNDNNPPYLQNDSLEVETGLVNGEEAVFIFDSKIKKGYIVKNSRLVSFNAGEGTCSTPSTNVTYGNSIISPPLATRAGYTFAGWFTAAEGGTQITTGNIITSDLTLYAHWNIVEITNIGVTRNARPGNTIKATPTVTGLVSGNTYTYCWTVEDANGTDVSPALTQDGQSVTFTAPEAGTYTLHLTIHEGETCSESSLLTTQTTTFSVLNEALVINMRCDPATNWSHTNCIYYFKTVGSNTTTEHSVWPGDTMTYLGVDSLNYPWFTYTMLDYVDYSGGSLVFNNNGTGLNQTIDIEIPSEDTKFYEVAASATDRKRNCSTISEWDLTPRIQFLSDTVNQYQGVTFTIAGKALFLPGENIRYTYSARIKNGAAIELDDNHAFIPTRENTNQTYIISITGTNEDSLSVSNSFEVRFLTNPITLSITGTNATDASINLTTKATFGESIKNKYFTYTIVEPGTTSSITIKPITQNDTVINNAYQTRSTGTYVFQVIISNNADGSNIYGKAEAIWTISPKSYFIKHPFVNKDTKPDGNDWKWKEMRYNGDGTYSYYEVETSFFHTGTGNDTIGANVFTSTQEGDQGYILESQIQNPNGITDNTEAIFVYSVQNNQLSVYPASTNMFRIKSVCEDGTYYSNTVSSASQQLSFFAEKAGSLIWQKWDKSSETWIDTTTITTKIPNNGVYIAYQPSGQLSANNFASLAVYTGDFTLYGEITQYGAGNGDTSAVFTKFTPNAYFENEYYNHYWVEYIHQNRNVLASVGNSINHNLAGILPYYKLPSGANVRYSYDNTTNLFQRTFLAGSALDNGQENPTYLRIYGDGIDTTRFDDGSDWVYSVSLEVNKNNDAPISAKLIANYHGFNRWILAEDGTENGIGASKVLLGKATSQRQYKLRLIYDYKTNRLTAGWTPDNDTIKTITYIDAEMLIVRNASDQDDDNHCYVHTISPGQVLDLDAIITIFDIDRSTMYEQKGDKYVSKGDSTHYYWLSLPYDCPIKDIYGFEGYGTKWYLEEYRGDIRADIGWLFEIPSFWSKMYLTDTLRANQGYAIYINPEPTDFEEYGGHSRLTIYFPSKRGTYTISNSAYIQNIEEHQCTITSPSDRTGIDSNWNVIGIPGYTTATINSATGSSAKVGTNETITTSTDGIRYYYHWNARNDYVAYDIKYATEADATKFQPTFAYMVQYAGDITWNTQAHLTNNTLAANRTRTLSRNHKYCIQLKDSSNKLRDQTFVVLDSLSSDEYELGYDLQKIISANTPQIYTETDDNYLAANQLSDTTSNIHVIISLPQSASYTIHLRECGQSLTPVLFDAEENTYTNLAESDYTFSGAAGKDDTRFSLLFGYVPQQTTSLPTLTTVCPPSISACVADGRIVINSHRPMSGTIRLFDAAGRLLSTCTLTEPSTTAYLPIPKVGGIYLLQTADCATRIIVP